VSTDAESVRTRKSDDAAGASERVAFHITSVVATAGLGPRVAIEARMLLPRQQ